MSTTTSGLLTQAQVDALLPAGAPAPEAPSVPRPWRFGRPATLAPAVRAQVDRLHGRFARALEVQLSTLLQQPVQVAVTGIETVAGSELAAALESPGAAFALRVAGTEATGVIDVGCELSLALVERLLGGPGGARGRRPLTAFEQALVRGIAERAVVSLGESWSSVAPTVIECLQFETDPALLRLAPAEPQLAAYLDLQLGDEHRDVVLALPVAALGARLRAGDPAEPPTASSSRSCVEEQLMRAHADLRVRFPEFRLSTRELLALQPGQVVHTQLPTDLLFDVHVNERLRFRGALGRLRRHLGVRVRELVMEGDAPPAPAIRNGRIL